MVDFVRLAKQMIGDLVESEGYELVHVEYIAQGPSPILRVYIDRPGGVNISDCAEVSRQISVLLDVEDLIPNQYTLEVSSPGIERPLFSAEDFERFRGKEIRLVSSEKFENRRNFTGLIVECAGGVLQLDCAGRVYSIPLAKVKRANLVYRFE